MTPDILINILLSALGGGGAFTFLNWWSNRKKPTVDLVQAAMDLVEQLRAEVKQNREDLSELKGRVGALESRYRAAIAFIHRQQAYIRKLQDILLGFIPASELPDGPVEPDGLTTSVDDPA